MDCLSQEFLTVHWHCMCSISQQMENGKSLFTGRINKNPSCDFSRMTELGLVDDNRVSPALKKNNYFVREKDKDLKFLLVFLYELF